MKIMIRLSNPPMLKSKTEHSASDYRHQFGFKVVTYIALKRWEDKENVISDFLVAAHAIIG